MNIYPLVIGTQNNNVELLSVDEESTEETCEEYSSVEDSTEDTSEELTSEELTSEELLNEESSDVFYECVYTPDDLIIIHEDLLVIHNDLQVIACIIIVLVVFKVLGLARTLIDAIF